MISRNLMKRVHVLSVVGCLALGSTACSDVQTSQVDAVTPPDKSKSTALQASTVSQAITIDLSESIAENVD